MAVEGLKIRRASALGGSIPPPGTSTQVFEMGWFTSFLRSTVQAP